MNQIDKDSIAWQYTKGMILSYAALATSLIKSSATTPEYLIKELDSYIKIFTKLQDTDAIVETVKLVKDMLLQLYENNNPSGDPPVKWLNDFIGNA